MNIDEMPAGREMDALVAEKVMSIRIISAKDTKAWNWSGGGGTVPHFRAIYPSIKSDTPCEAESDSDTWVKIVKPYSTDISVAWEVAEKVYAMFEEDSKRDYSRNSVTVEKSNAHGFGKFWRCQIGSMISAIALTAPLAICRAALKAVM